MYKIITIGVLFSLVSLTGYGQKQLPGGVPVFKTWLQGAELSATGSKDLNFNSTSLFPNTTQSYLDFEDMNLAAATIFTVYTQDESETEKFIWGIKNHKDEFHSILSTKRFADLERKRVLNFKSQNLHLPQINTFFRSGENQADQHEAFSLEIARTDSEGNLPFQNFAGSISEVIVFEYMISPIDRQKVESYLSIKYGVPFSSDLDRAYLNSKGEKIWDANIHRTHQFLPTAIGRDDLSGLYQKQSTNAYAESSVVMGLEQIAKSNTENDAHIIENEFLFWSNNGMPLNPILDHSTHLKHLERTWKVVPYGTSQVWKTQVSFDPRQLFIRDSETLWLVQWTGEETNEEAKYHEVNASIDYEMVFDEISWDVDYSGSDLFSFAIGPKMICEIQKYDGTCTPLSYGEVSIEVKGGEGPYQIKLSNDMEDIDIVNEQIDNKIRVSDLLAGIYTIDIEDQHGLKYQRTITIENEDQPLISVQRTHQILDHQPIEISLDEVDPLLEYTWLLDGEIVGYGLSFLCTKPGTYALKSSDGTCDQYTQFFVEEVVSDKFEHLTLYPNPASPNTPVSIKLELPDKDAVHIKVLDASGRRVDSFSSPSAHYHFLELAMRNPGLYFIQIQTKLTTETRKLIVQ